MEIALAISNKVIHLQQVYHDCLSCLFRGKLSWPNHDYQDTAYMTMYSEVARNKLLFLLRNNCLLLCNI